MPLTLEHHVALVDPRAHLVEITTTVRDDGPLPSPLTLFMPVWTPGSYLVREYARHVEAFECTIDGAPAPARKVRKNAWECAPNGAHSVIVRYRLYCNELTVRTNHVDATHAYLNGAATFVAVEGATDASAVVEVHAPEGWRIATALPAAPAPGGRGRPAFLAADLDALVDAPLEIGLHRDTRFSVLGVPHQLIVHPESAISEAEIERLATHTRAILEAEARLIGGGLPYARYLVQLHLSPRGRGGLEHMESCTLIASPQSLGTRDGYLDLLSLIAHEALHAWNVKRIRPAGLTPYRYETENYTRLLWWFEGGTSYYDWRVLRLADICSTTEYLAHLAEEIGYVESTHGRLVHSLEEASFDAWIKLYRPDENTSNSTISYYRKGEVVCALLDLEIRVRSSGRSSLDAALRHLWQAYGARGIAVPEDGMLEIFEGATETSLGDLFDAWVRAPGDIAYAPTLACAGLNLERHARADAPKCSLGMRVRSEGSRTLVTSVVRGAAAQRAGIDPGDEVVAIAGHRLEGAGVDAALHGRTAGERVDVLLARDGRALARTASLDGPRLDRVRLMARADATSAERALFKAWLGASHPSWETS